MSRETNSSVLSPLIDPEAGHNPKFIEFVTEDNRFSHIIMEIGQRYKIIHTTPIGAIYQQEEVLIHNVTGTFKIAKPKHPAVDTPAFFCILNEATVTFSESKQSGPKKTVSVEKYFFTLTTDSSVTQVR